MALFFRPSLQLLTASRVGTLLPEHLLLWGRLGMCLLKEMCLYSNLANCPIFQIRVIYPVSSIRWASHPTCLLIPSLLSSCTEFLIQQSKLCHLEEPRRGNLDHACASYFCVQHGSFSSLPFLFYHSPLWGALSFAVLKLVYPALGDVPRRAPFRTIKIWERLWCHPVQGFLVRRLLGILGKTVP